MDDVDRIRDNLGGNLADPPDRLIGKLASLSDRPQETEPEQRSAASSSRSEAVVALENARRLAEEIVTAIGPQTVLDVGCSTGLLVAAFWDRGVEAAGVDVAIENPELIRPDIRSYLSFGTLAPPSGQHFDLITCFGSLEQVGRSEVGQVIHQMAKAGDSILFLPGIGRPGAINQRNFLPLFAWLRIFAREGLAPDVGFDAGFIGPQAFLLRRRDVPLASEVLRLFARLVHGRVTIDASERERLRLITAIRRLEKELDLEREKHRAVAGELAHRQERDIVLEQAAQVATDDNDRLLREREDLLTNLRAATKELETLRTRSREREEQLGLLQGVREQFLEARKQTAGFLSVLESALAERDAARGKADWYRRAGQKDKDALERELAGLRRSYSELEQRFRQNDSVLREILASPGWAAVQKYRDFSNQTLSRFPLLKTVYEKSLGAVLRRAGGPAAVAPFEAHVVALETTAAVEPSGEMSSTQPSQALETASWIGRFRSRHWTPRHTELVSVIVAVHNALDVTKSCLTAVLEHSTLPFELIIVDDGSDPNTRDYVARFSQEHDVKLLRNERALGYTYAANQGVRAARGNYLVLLNSDAIVSVEWLDRLVLCADSSPELGMVGPLSNTASWQSIPDLAEGSDWAVNTLPAGWTLDDMARSVAEFSTRCYPRVGFLNGFCLLVKRELLDAIGPFDEETFGEGYGEENDYCVRARLAGWELAVADDTYVLHHQSRSYSDSQRKQLCERADQALRAKHGDEIVDTGLEPCVDGYPLLGIRARARATIERQSLVAKARDRWSRRRIAFVLPASDPAGGVNVVLNEARAMRRFGVDVRIINLQCNGPAFALAYPDLELPVLYAEKPSAIPEIAAEFDAVVGTIHRSIYWIQPLEVVAPGIRLGYYVQDYEPWFYEGADREVAFHSYSLIPGMTRLTKSRWNREKVRSITGLDCQIVGPSCDIDLFCPRDRRAAAHEQVAICAMVRPGTPWRSPRETMELLAKVWQRHGSYAPISIFGVAPDDPEFLELPQDFEFVNHGVLSSEQLAELFNHQDVFVDMSRFQAMGLTALEAMACGVIPIVPRDGGCVDFAEHDENAVVVDTAEPGECLDAVTNLIMDGRKRNELRRRALRDVVRFSPERAAFNILNCLLPDGEAEQ